MSAYPLELKQIDASTLGIRWSDGTERRYPVRELRLECPCAHCIDEWTREKRIREENVPGDVKPVRMETVGRYAIRIFWSDGHHTGIYPFDSLKELGQELTPDGG